ncbi:DUF1579 family protein [Nitrospirillum pindoramense]|uniref:Uncharacterized protein DUF1579 n=1 Tax=Nitrospirillum amazonense TaxID=28077 RepID=A0A560GV54_9PROT|nr:DUF1579 family protein [Nitrospirillum amazonense]TWB37681.1 uncharacterized protein DUF1579 [Nitrospirillum amazonense]
MHEEMRRLIAAFAGDWLGTDAVQSGPAASSNGVGKGRMTVRPALNGHHLLLDYVFDRGADGTFAAHGVLTWDPDVAVHLLFWFDDMGYVPANPAPGLWGPVEGAEEPGAEGYTFIRTSPRGRARHRYWWPVPDHMETAIDRSADGGLTWTPFLKGTYRRQG